MACSNDAYFVEAAEFRPERWLNGETSVSDTNALVVPFGIGKRMCPGRRFVEMELTILLAKVNLWIFNLD